MRKRRMKNYSDTLYVRLSSGRMITVNSVLVVGGQSQEVDAERNDNYCLVCNYLCLLIRPLISCRDREKDREEKNCFHYRW